MDSEASSSKKNLLITVGIIVLVILFAVIGFFSTRNRVSQTTESVNQQTKEASDTSSQGSLEPTLEPVAPEMTEYTEGKKYGFSLSYPQAYGYATIDASSVPSDTAPLLALSFSDKWAGGGSETSFTSADFPKTDPTFIVYDAKGKALEEWVNDFMKRQVDGKTPSLISKKLIAVDNQPGYAVVTTTDGASNAKKTYIVFFEGKIYEFGYFLENKPGHALAILNNTKFSPSTQAEE